MKLNLIGKFFGKWKVIERCEKLNDGQTRWKCVCTCGTIKVVRQCHLRSGASASCGCTIKEAERKRNVSSHKMSHTRFYKIWSGILSRCNNKNSNNYIRYGKRGIKNKWDSFDSFKNDMYLLYLRHVNIFGIKETTIDRIDVNGNYCKENCEWKTWKEQSINKRGGVLYNGTRLPLTEWAKKLKINVNSLYDKIYRLKISKEKALRIMDNNKD